MDIIKTFIGHLYFSHACTFVVFLGLYGLIVTAIDSSFSPIANFYFVAGAFLAVSAGLAGFLTFVTIRNRPKTHRVHAQGAVIRSTFLDRVDVQSGSVLAKHSVASLSSNSIHLKSNLSILRPNSIKCFQMIVKYDIFASTIFPDVEELIMNKWIGRCIVVAMVILLCRRLLLLEDAVFH